MAKRAVRRASPTSSASDVKVMELVQRSGILNKSATLDQIMALSMTLVGSGASDAARAKWVFISKWYVLWGNQTK